jgi:hypothetical protein
MNDGYTWWLLVLGIAIGVAIVWLAAIRLPRRDDDQTRAEQAAEARWISATIERDGGIAPQALVEEVLELHRGYLASGAVASQPPSPGDPDPMTEPAGR